MTVRIAAAWRNIPITSMPTTIAGHPGQNKACAIADPIEVNAVLFVVNCRKVLLATFDLLYIGGELELKLRSDLREQFGFADQDILLFASHTHFAPATDVSLPVLGLIDNHFCEDVRNIVRELVDELVCDVSQPLRLELKRGTLHHSVNRRRPRNLPIITRSRGLLWPRVTLAPNERGFRNETATVGTLLDANTNLTRALFWHYGCHPVSHSPRDVVSAEFPGVVRSRLRQMVGRDVPVLFIQGFCGDVRPKLEEFQPRNLIQRAINIAVDLLRGAPFMEVTPEGWRQWSSSMADTILRIAQEPPLAEDVPQAVITASIGVPVTSFFQGRTRRSTMYLRGLQLGNELEFLGFGAEPVAEWIALLNEKCPPSRRVRLLAGYCGDVFGYLPVAAQLDEGGYEVVDFQLLMGADGAFIKSNLEPAICSAAVTLVKTMDAVGAASHLPIGDGAKTSV